MEKPLWHGNRGERRWRSWKKWMRRLKADQATHTGPWSPRLVWKDGICTVLPGDRTELCDCFNLATMQAIRFKDTPNGCNCRSCANPRRTYDGKNLEALTFAERRSFLDDRENWSKRKRREGQHLSKVHCRTCGCMIGSLWVKNGESLYTRIGQVGWDRRCTSCRKRYLESLEKVS